MTDALGQVIRTTQYAFYTDPSWTNFTIDGTTDAIAFIFQAETSDPITGMWFKYGLRTGTPVAHTFGLEGVNASGEADGTDVGGGSPTAASFTPPASTAWDGLGQWITLTNSFTPTRGEYYAAVIRPTGTPDGSNNSSFAARMASLLGSQQRPFVVTYNAGTPTKNSGAAAFAYKTASKRFGLPWESVYSTATAATTGHALLCKFTVPAGWGDTFKIRAVRALWNYGGGGGGEKTVSILSAAKSTLQSVTATQQVAIPSTGRSPQTIVFNGSLATLSYGTEYYLEFKNTDAKSFVMTGIQVTEADDRLAFPLSTNCCLTTYDGSTYTDNTLVVPAVEFVLEDIAEPAGGGGGGGGYVIGG